MSKNFSLIIVAVIIFVGAGYLYTSRDYDAANQETMVANQDPNSTDQEKDDGQVEVSNQYVQYSNEVLASSSSNRRVLFFYASWCPTCIPADADFEKNTSLLPSDLTVIRVNYSDPDTDKDEKALATKYGITYQHTYVQIDSSGNEIIKWNGGATEELLAKIK